MSLFRPSRRNLLSGVGLISLGAAMPFSRWYAKANTTPQKPAIRAEINTLDPNGKVIRDLVTGLRRMIALPDSHPLSWVFHANVHLTKDDPAALYPGWPEAAQMIGPLWNNCPHGSYYFLPWHRLYLYFLERRIRHITGSADFALPYWNYVSDLSSQRQIPALFRSRFLAGGFNPLYVADTALPPPAPTNGRDPRYNQGAILDLADVSITRAFSFQNFAVDQGMESFGGHPPPQSFLFGALEETPHNNIHAAIGGTNGLLGNLNVAARDPLFFAHHANVDRLWESWLALGQGRVNPINDAQWMGKTWSFVDEHLNIVTITPAEALDIATQLGYAYADLQPAPQSTQSVNPQAVGQTAFVLSNVVFDHNGTSRLVTTDSFSQADTRWSLMLDNISASTDPGASFGIWITSGASKNLKTDHPGFVGAVALLGMGGHHHHSGSGQSRHFDITAQMNALGSAADLSITIAQIRPTDPTGRETDVLPHGTIEIGTIRIDRL